MDKKFLIILALIIGATGFLIFGTKGSKSSNNTNNSNAAAVPTSHLIGTNSKKVTLVAYEDFECPVCGQYYPVLEQIKDKYKDQISFQFRNFPLPGIHKNALAAHRAAEAASNQGKFWEMYNKLYSNQSAWSSEGDAIATFEQYAKDLGLDLVKYKADQSSEQTLATINADIAEGKKLKVTGTPGFAINGVRFENPSRSLEAFSKVIDEAIAAANPTTTPVTTAP
jgi:protein-disulfide isomerase